MQHVNEPPPSVLERRPDVPAARSRARSSARSRRTRRTASPRWTRSSPSSRRASPSCGEPRGRRDATRDRCRPRSSARAAPRRARAPRRRRGSSRRCSSLAARSRPAASVRAPDDSPKASTPRVQDGRRRRGGVAVDPASARYDPTAGDGEHPERAPSRPTATRDVLDDRDATGGVLQKHGVGLVLDAGAQVALEARSSSRPTTPGFTARDPRGDEPRRALRARSRRSRSSTAHDDLRARQGKRSRYWVVWITRPRPEPARAHERGHGDGLVGVSCGCARGARPRARSAARGARRTGSPTPRRASRTRSSR